MSDVKVIASGSTRPSSPEEVLSFYSQRIRALCLQSASEGDHHALAKRQQILQDFFHYNSSLDRLLEGGPFIASDLEVLCRHQDVPLVPAVVQALTNLGDSLEKRIPPAWQESMMVQTKPIGPATKELLRRPLLTSTDYALFNALAYQAKDRFLNLATLFDPRNSEYFRYEVIRDLRKAFSCVFFVMTHFGNTEVDPRVRDWVFRVFQDPSPVLEMPIFKKMNVAILLRKNQLGFQHANSSCEQHLSNLLGQIEQVLGHSGLPLLKQVRAVFACEYWSGVQSLDLIVKKLSLKRPDLEQGLKTSFIAWKNYIFEMQNRQTKIRDIIGAKGGDVVLDSDVHEELLISVGIFTDFIGALDLTQDLLKRIQEESFSHRFFAQLLSFLLTTLIPGIRKYECLGQGEYNNTEKAIQQKTLSMATSLQRILKRSEKRQDPLPSEVFRGTVYVYHELLAQVFAEKNREYLKPSEKEVLADSPMTPNLYYLFEKKPQTVAAAYKSPFVPVTKAWPPFLAVYGMTADQIMPLAVSDPAEVLETLRSVIQAKNLPA